MPQRQRRHRRARRSRQAHGGARRRRRRRRRRAGDGAPDSLCSDRELLADRPVLRDLKPGHARAPQRADHLQRRPRGVRVPRRLRRQLQLPDVPQAHQPLGVHASPPLVARPRLRFRGGDASIDAPLVYQAVVARRRVVATARRRVRFRSDGRGFARPSGRRVFAGALGAVTRDARDRGRARLRRARARGTRRGPAAGRARGRLGRAFHRTPHPARRPARPTSRVARPRNPRARRLRTAANRRAAPPAPGPHASAGLPLRCAPHADRRHPRAKSLSRLACHTICGARVEAPAPTPRPLPSSDGGQPRAPRRYYFSRFRVAREKRESLSVARSRIFLRKLRLIIYCS